MEYILLLVGFVLLIKGADFFVEGSSNIARFLGVPSLIIGLTIVALGTSAPEASVSILASMDNNSDISLSNILGSNIFNLLMIIGICCIIHKSYANKEIIKRDFPISILTTLLLIIYMLDNKISLIEGISLFIIFISYISYLIIYSMKNKQENTTTKPSKSLVFYIITGILGLGGVIYGGNLVVDNACIIANNLGVSDTLIGLTIVAVGTSLPELVTSIVAIRKGQISLAFGNVLGSNILNIICIVGLSSIIKPLTCNFQYIIDALFLLTASIIMLLILYKKKYISRLVGCFCVLSYIGYMVYVALR